MPERGDGRMIHTPALEGMSGAAIWKIGTTRGGASIELAGVQSAFLHSRYLRGDAIASIEPFLQRWPPESRCQKTGFEPVPSKTAPTNDPGRCQSFGPKTVRAALAIRLKDPIISTR